MKFLIFIFTFLFTFSAQASVILFFDLNNAPPEIAAIKRALKFRCENSHHKDCPELVVIPAPTHRSAEMSVTEAELTQTLTQLYKKGLTVESLVVSGHSSGLEFSGTRGQTTFEGILNSFTTAAQQAGLDEKKVRSKLKTLYLFGCYTGTPGAYKRWIEEFPGLKLAAGFNHKAPLSNNPNLPSYIENLVKKENDAINICELSAAGKFYDSVRNSHVVKASMCLNQQYVTPDEKHDLAKIWELKCNPNKNPRYAKLLKSGNIFESYLYAKASTGAGKSDYSNVPPDPAHSELRDYYNLLQDHRICFEGDPETELPSPDRVQRLIFFDAVLKNFSLYYKDRLAHLKKLIKKKLNIDAPDLGGGRKKMSRRKVLDFYTNHLFGKLLSPKHLPHLTANEDNELRETINLISNMVKNVNPDCVSQTWIEPAHSVSELSKPAADCSKFGLAVNPDVQ